MNPVQVHDTVDSKFQLISVASDRVVESRSTACVPFISVIYNAVVSTCVLCKRQCVLVKFCASKMKLYDEFILKSHSVSCETQA